MTTALRTPEQGHRKTAAGKDDRRASTSAHRQALIEGLNHDLAGEYQARRSAAMTSYERPEFVRRMLIALGRALRRGILGKSSHDYVKQFSGSDEYWDRAMAAQLGWPEKQPPKPDPNRIRSSGHAVVRAKPGLRSSALSLPQPDSLIEVVNGPTST